VSPGNCDARDFIWTSFGPCKLHRVHDIDNKRDEWTFAQTANTCEINSAAKDGEAVQTQFIILRNKCSSDAGQV